MDVFPLKDGSCREVSLVSAMCFLQQIEALAVSSDVVTVGFFFFSFHEILSESLVLHPQQCRCVCPCLAGGVHEGRRLLRVAVRGAKPLLQKIAKLCPYGQKLL